MPLDHAARERALGHRTPGSLVEFLDSSRLKESTGALTARQMLGELASDHEAVVRRVRDAVRVCESAGDDGSVDFLTGLLRDHEKTAWMLRSHLEG